MGRKNQQQNQQANEQQEPQGDSTENAQPQVATEPASSQGVPESSAQPPTTTEPTPGQPQEQKPQQEPQAPERPSDQADFKLHDRMHLYRHDCPAGRLFEGREAVRAAVDAGWTDHPSKATLASSRGE